jgi:hypothetical protein
MMGGTKGWALKLTCKYWSKLKMIIPYNFFLVTYEEAK